MESSFGSNTSFGHHFDLSKHIDATTIDSCNIKYCKLDMDSGKVNGKMKFYYLFLLDTLLYSKSKTKWRHKTKTNTMGDLIAFCYLFQTT